MEGSFAVRRARNFSLDLLGRIGLVLREGTKVVVHSLIGGLEAGRVERTVVNYGQYLGVENSVCMEKAL